MSTAFRIVLSVLLGSAVYYFLLRSTEAFSFIRGRFSFDPGFPLFGLICLIIYGILTATRSRY